MICAAGDAESAARSEFPWRAEVGCAIPENVGELAGFAFPPITMATTNSEKESVAVRIILPAGIRILARRPASRVELGLRTGPKLRNRRSNGAASPGLRSVVYFSCPQVASGGQRAFGGYPSLR